VKRLIPESIVGRTLVVLLLGLAVSHGFSIALYFDDRVTILELAGGEHVGERIATTTRLFEKATPRERRQIIELADNPRLRVAWGAEPTVAEDAPVNWEVEVLRRSLLAHLGSQSVPRFRIGHATETMTGTTHVNERATSEHRTILVSLELPDRGWLNFSAPVEIQEPFWSFKFILSIVVMISAVGILSVLVVFQVTAPLRVFAQAAQRLGVKVDAPPLPETGPIEVRRAVHAFNEMQSRIRRFVTDRIQMIAAISHDLRTPLTRMRLRADLISDQEQQAKMLHDLDEMESMISSVLSFARDDAAAEPQSHLDLDALLQSICDDMSDAGEAVEISGQPGLLYTGQRMALKRAFTNLIDNALKYGMRARVRLVDDEDWVTVEIDDDGPGIPDSEKEKVFESFYRIEQSRSRDTGGTGLGLAFTRAIIRRHGGDITLHNRVGGGLRVEVTLPR
jgi:signal transduction histidine kinase